MKFQYYIASGMILIAVFACIIGCLGAGDPGSVNPTSNICHPNDYTNGVYYFACNDADFGNALSAWKKEHPDQVVTAIGVSDRGGYGYTIGYFVSTESRGNITKV